MIVVAGMNITTSILMIDLIVQYRDEGVPRDEAVPVACAARLRPILMTTAITVISIVPAGFFPATGQDAYRQAGCSSHFFNKIDHTAYIRECAVVGW